MTTFDAAIATSQGARRYQEDAAVAWPGRSREPRLLAVLADGMGGHAGGARASELICQTMVATFGARVGIKSGTVQPHDLERAVGPVLTAALDAANAAIAATVDEQPALSGMGSTLIAVVFAARGAEWISVGDSPLYSYCQGVLTQINEDHSLAPTLDQMAADGRITAQAARNDPRRHMLRSAVTGEDLDLIDRSVGPLQLDEGDYVVLASDGIHSIDEAEIALLISAEAAAGPQAVADALVRAVLARGELHQDNVTVMAVRLSPAIATDDAA
jgi:PPM family protein phosphatase